MNNKINKVIPLFVVLWAFFSTSLNAQTGKVFEGEQVSSRSIGSDDFNKLYKNYQLYRMDVPSIEKYAKNAENKFSMRFRFNEDHDWDIQLEKHEFRCENYVLRVSTDEGMIYFPERPTITYKGSLRNDPNSDVRMTISGNYITGLIITGCLFHSCPGPDRFYIEKG